ncbi:MAG: SsrA-binding protein SmpB [Myxococcota bacterium]
MATTSSPHDAVQVIATNRRARHDYAVLSTLECGLVLQGTEVKSLRQHHVHFGDSYALLRAGELFLLGMNIDPFSHGTHSNHEPQRTRKLLVHKRELRKLNRHVQQARHTLIPLQLHFRRGRAKVLLALAQGKTHTDKRKTIQQRDMDREVGRVLKRGNR